MTKRHYFAKVDGADEERLADVALQLVDLGRALTAKAVAASGTNPTRTEIEAATICLLTQAIFMADFMDQREDSDLGFAAIDPDVLEGRFRGLGMGTGHCMGALPRVDQVLEAIEWVGEGTHDALGKRIDQTRQDWRKRRG